MRARVFVTLKPSVFDPQGRTVTEALHTLGYDAVRKPWLIRSRMMLNIGLFLQVVTTVRQVKALVAQGKIGNLLIA